MADKHLPVTDNDLDWLRSWAEGKLIRDKNWAPQERALYLRICALMEQG